MAQVEQVITLTPSAVARIASLRANEGNAALMLRLTVSGGGCSGFQYGFSLDDRRQDDDIVFDCAGVGLVVDSTSLGLVAGSVVDFKEDLVGAYFSVANPNAKSSCGCGSSFSI